MAALLAHVVAQSRPVPSGDPDIGLFVLLTVLGFAIGAFGHLISSNKLIALGIALVVLATTILPIVFLAGEAGGPD